MDNQIVVSVLVTGVAYTVVAAVVKCIWKVIRIRVFGFKPAGLDEEQLAHTVAYCPRQYIRELQRINGDLDKEDERKFLADMEKYTSFVVMTYLDNAKA